MVAWAEDNVRVRVARVSARGVRNRWRFMRTDGVKAALWY